MGMSGADADALDRVGVQLERSSGSLRRKGKTLASALNSAPWRGRKADQYRRDFNSVHLRSINQAAQFLDDAYENLRRNADEQREASGSRRRSLSDEIGIFFGRMPHFIGGFFDGARGWGGNLFRPSFTFPRMPKWRHFPSWTSPRLPNLILNPWAIPKEPAPWVASGLLSGILVGIGRLVWEKLPKKLPPSAPNGGPAPSSGAKPAPAPAAPAPAPATVNQGPSGGGPLPAGRGTAAVPGFFTAGAGVKGSEWQCTDWAIQRRRDLGFPDPKLGLRGTDLVTGNGADMARFNGGTPTTQPTFGAYASYGSGTGHVMIVEHVSDDRSTIRVSEMNISGKVLQGEDFRADSILTRENGTWTKTSINSAGVKRVQKGLEVTFSAP